jgi:hypothetical protein
MISYLWAVIKWGLIVGGIAVVFLVILMALHAWSLSAGDLD